MNSVKQILLPTGSSLFALALLLSASLALVGCDSGAETAQSSSNKAKTGTVNVKIDFNGKGGNKEFLVPCSDDSTVYSILERAQNIGEIKIQSAGSGETAFLKSIDGVENQGASGDNWVYRVDGKMAKIGCGVYQVKPGVEVEWRFGKYPE